MAEAGERQEEVAAFLRGDAGQIAAVEQAVRATVRSFRFDNRDLESDLVQETLSRVLVSLSCRRFQGEASLRTYARNVARYACLEHIRRRRCEVEADAESLAAASRWSAPEETLLTSEEHRRNLEAFAALSTECQEILRLICLQGASYREVASKLGLSEAALKSRIHRCRLTCREAAAAGPVRRPLLLALRKVTS